MGACPCSMLLEFASFFNQHIHTGKWLNTKYNLQLIFFDGEEALKSWSHEDSLYGSKHLSEKWKNEVIIII